MVEEGDGGWWGGGGGFESNQAVSVFTVFKPEECPSLSRQGKLGS